MSGHFKAGDVKTLHGSALLRSSQALVVFLRFCRGLGACALSLTSRMWLVLGFFYGFRGLGLEVERGLATSDSKFAAPQASLSSGDASALRDRL